MLKLTFRAHEIFEISWPLLFNNQPVTVNFLSVKFIDKEPCQLLIRYLRNLNWHLRITNTLQNESHHKGKTSCHLTRIMFLQAVLAGAAYAFLVKFSALLPNLMTSSIPFSISSCSFLIQIIQAGLLPFSSSHCLL